MKKILLSALTIIGVMALKAQTVSNTTIEILKAKQPGMVVNFNRTPDMMEDALKKRLSADKVSSSDKVKGGFRVYKGVLVPEISSDKIDLYYKVDGKKENASLFLLVSKGYDNFVDGTKDETTFENVQNFANSLEVNAKELKLLADIEKAKEAVEKAEKSLKNAEENGADLVKQKEKIEKSIEENKSTQKDRAKDIQTAKENLDALRALLGK